MGVDAVISTGSSGVWVDVVSGCAVGGLGEVWVAIALGLVLRFAWNRRGKGDLVERRPCRSSFRWPLSVAIDLGKCFRTRLEVKPGQVAKKPLSIALHQVDMQGLNAVACKKVTNSFLLFVL